MAKTDSLTLERAQEAFNYDPETGEFTWRISQSRGYAGTRAGTTDHDGYRLLSIDGVRYKAHRVAWLITHGRWPADVIDHIDGNTGNNSLINLREASVGQNQENRHRVSSRMRNPSGYIGVRWHERHRRWYANIGYGNRQRKYLGHFATAEDARDAYLAAKLIFHSRGAGR